MSYHGPERRNEGWSMWKDVLATFFGALGALATVVGPIAAYGFNWMRDRDRTEAATEVRVKALENSQSITDARAAADRRELIDRLSRIEGILLNPPRR